MEEIKRLQQLAGILTEIKVNNPTEPEFPILINNLEDWINVCKKLKPLGYKYGTYNLSSIYPEPDNLPMILIKTGDKEVRLEYKN